jgi:hypothetical protein
VYQQVQSISDGKRLLIEQQQMDAARLETVSRIPSLFLYLVIPNPIHALCLFFFFVFVFFKSILWITFLISTFLCPKKLHTMRCYTHLESDPMECLRMSNCCAVTQHQIYPVHKSPHSLVAQNDYKSFNSDQFPYMAS